MPLPVSAPDLAPRQGLASPLVPPSLGFSDGTVEVEPSAAELVEAAPGAWPAAAQVTEVAWAGQVAEVAWSAQVTEVAWAARVAEVARAAGWLARLASGQGEGEGEGEGPARQLAPGGRGQALAEAVGLDEDELALLWSIAARTVEPRVGAHLRTIDARAREGLSLAHHAALWGLGPARTHALLRVADPRHPLRELGLIAPASTAAMAASGGAAMSPATSSWGIDVDTPWIAAHRIASYLAGGDELDAAVALHGGLVAPVEGALFDEAQAAVLGQLAGWLAAGSDATIALEGPRGAGRRTAVACAASPWPVVMLDGARVAASAAVELVVALRREAALRGAVPMLANLDELLDRMSPAERLALGSALDRVRGPLVVTAATPALEVPAARRSVLRVRWPVPGVALRRQLWERALVGETGSAADHAALSAEELDLLAERYRLGAGGVQAAVRSATLRAQERGEAAGLADLVAGVQDNIAERLGELARRVEVQQRWSELVLPADTEDDVRALIGRIRHAHQVLEGWGFRQKLPRGSGVAALFSGPPGTGKTMVAGLIARELSLELYQVDLSRIVSKWVGETEKQLAKVFEAAEAGHALLLFDEADALFAKRSTDVKSAVDRYANLEVNYLLQRIESFGGVVILTTNLDASIDPALRRRLASHIAFTLPEAAERERLWHEMLSTGAPLAGDLDLASLAEEFEGMSGANIRNAVLAAAFLAAGEGALLGAAHLRRAARIEYRAMGHVLGKDQGGGLR